MTYRIRVVNRTSPLAVVACCLLILGLIGGTGALWRWTHPLPPVVLTVEQTSVVERSYRCIKNLECVGGFAETNEGYVLRIDYRRALGFQGDTLTLSLTTLEIWTRPSEEIVAARLKKIVIPSNSEWDKYALRYAMQFVPKKK